MTSPLELSKRLREHALGPDVCPKCGNTKNNFLIADYDDERGCREEGQCDWNMHNGLHSSNIDDVFKAKEDMLEASKILGQY